MMVSTSTRIPMKRPLRGADRGSEEQSFSIVATFIIIVVTWEKNK